MENLVKLSRNEIKKRQVKLLKSILIKAYKRIEFYKKRYREVNVNIDSIKNLRDLQKLPLVRKDDMCKNFRDFLLNKKIVEWHATSGTTGTPTLVGFTKNDVAIQTELEVRNLLSIGVKRGDTVLNTISYGLFVAGMMLHNALIRIGATVVPSGKTSLVDQQVLLIENFHPTVLIGTPQFLIRLAYIYEELTGKSPESTSVRKIYSIGEPLPQKIRKKIEDMWNAKVFIGYGLTEIGSGAECEERNGVHWPEDHIITEVIDPKTQEVIEDGKGELVYTTLTKTGTVAIRFKSGDFSSVIKEPCSCGRNFIRILPPKYRIDDLVKIRGTLLSPYVIDEVMFQIPYVKNYLYIIKRDEKTLRDIIKVYVEAKENKIDPELISRKLQAFTWVKPNTVKIVKKNSIPLIGNKPRRFFDLRNGKKSIKEVEKFIEQNNGIKDF
ncbi:MAG: AMP-binding protein [candidate division WOR-3 bacterium]